MALKGLFEHQRGCTPLRPCTACEVLVFLRAELPEEKFKELVRIASGTRESKVKRVKGEAPVTRESISKAAKLDEYLTLSADALSALSRAGVKTMGDLLKHSKSSLRESTDIDGRALRGLAGQLEKLGSPLKN